jgi:uncharacterized membrane protein YeaQ/YmgE (transglycosylase-associated protein family)
MNFSFLGGRTFSLVVGVCVACILMRWFEHLDNGSFTAIMLGIPGAFVAKSTVERHTEIRADVQKTLGGLQADTPPSDVEQVKA